jgi:hypothetical protein
MKKLAMALVLLGAGWMLRSMFDGAPPRAEAGDGPGGGAEVCTNKNGDVDGSGAVDLSDALSILGFLFLGSPPQLPPLCASSPKGLPDTGQDVCFDCDGNPVRCKSCQGQPRPCDGFLQPFLSLQDSMQRTGCPNDASRFTDNGDRTVTDNCTGLQWLQESGETPDVDQDGHPDPVTWCQAMEFCQGLTFAGHSDWRLPNVRELQSLVDYGRSKPAFAPVFRLSGNPTADVEFYLYWTSTSVIDKPQQVFVVDFGVGNVIPFYRVPDPVFPSGNIKLRLRAVRG